MSGFAYSSRQVADMFKIALETVRSWAQEFEEHLSPRANPGKNRNRAFTQEDLEVLALVAQLKKEGLTFDDIHVALKNGERGTPPPLKVEDRVVPVDSGEYITAENQRLQLSLQEAHKALEMLKDEKSKLEARLEASEVERNKLEGQLEKRITELKDEIRELAQKAGEEYGRGYVEGFERGRKDDEE